MGAANTTSAIQNSPQAQAGQNPFSTQTPAMTPTYTNPVNPADYQPINLTNSSAFQDFQNAQNAVQNQYNQAAMQSANQQAIQNTREIGGQYGALGAGNSGAAYAAMAEGANRPLYEAQTQMAQMANENTNHLYDSFTGVTAPQYMQDPSPYEQTMGQYALQSAQRDANAS